MSTNGMSFNIDDSWRWVDNSAVQYVNWESGSEPTDVSCAKMNIDGQWVKYWSGIDCSDNGYTICKKEKGINLFNLCQLYTLRW